MSLELKNSVERILFSSLGMIFLQAIVFFFKQVELYNGLPFNIALPPKRIFDDDIEKTFAVSV